jgi:[acyl-carrier-protein] S-malonyltransferase
VSGVAFVFPGQGSQSVGMAHRVADAFPSAARAFATADATLAEPLTRLAWDGPAEELDLTVNAQPALLAASIAFLRALEAARAAAGVPPLLPAFHAGHSMGQYSALVAAGVIDLDAGLRLVRERGRQMQAAGGDGAMAAIIGLDDARLPELVKAGQAHGVFGVANRNSPGQVVVSGQRPAVEAAVEAARGLGARRAILLPVSVAAHSPLMAPAAAAMRLALAPVPFADPRAPLLANADAGTLTSGEACRGELVEHLTTGVDWVAAVGAMRAAGVTTFIEVGPGKVLSGLIRRIAPDAATIALDDPAAPQGLAPEALLPDPTTTALAQPIA